MLSKQSIIYLLVLCLSFMALSGCGFRLRGSVEAPAVLKEVHIKGLAEYSALNQELRRVLQRSGTTFIATPENALSVIELREEKFSKRVLSVDAQGRAAEFELLYKFSFTVTQKTKVLVPNQTIELNRDFRFDPNNVLAKDAEEAQIRKEMVSLSVRQMMRRIESHLKNL